jgi:ABC-type transport system involved in cytochrome c biogenesis permease subunit
MSTALQLLQVALPTLYVLAAALHGAAVAGHATRSAQLRRVVLTATLGAHATWFVLIGWQQGQSPITGLWPTVSAVVFSAVGFWILVAREERHVGSGGVVLSVAAVFQLLASGFGPIEPDARAAQSTLSLVHVLTSVVAAAATLSSSDLPPRSTTTSSYACSILTLLVPGSTRVRTSTTSS